jgi:hypothetical protein
MEATNDGRKEGRSVRKSTVHPRLDTKRYGADSQVVLFRARDTSSKGPQKCFHSVRPCFLDTFSFLRWVKAQDRRRRIWQRTGPYLVTEAEEKTVNVDEET